MKIESDAKDKQIREMELSTPGRTDIFNFEMNDFSDFENDDDRTGEKSMRIKTPFHSI